MKFGGKFASQAKRGAGHCRFGARASAGERSGLPLAPDYAHRAMAARRGHRYALSSARAWRRRPPWAAGRGREPTWRRIHDRHRGRRQSLA